MTEEELLDNFESKLRRYLSELDKSSLIGSFGPAANAYFDAAQNLGASLLLRMVEAYREQEGLRRQVDVASAELAAALNERDELQRSVATGEAEMVGLREQVRAMAAQVEAAIATHTEMEGAGCHVITALKAAKANGSLSDSQRGLIEEALAMMIAAKPVWLSLPPKEQAELLARGRAAIAGKGSAA